MQTMQYDTHFNTTQDKLCYLLMCNYIRPYHINPTVYQVVIWNDCRQSYISEFICTYTAICIIRAWKCLDHRIINQRISATENFAKNNVASRQQGVHINIHVIVLMSTGFWAEKW